MRPGDRLRLRSTGPRELTVERGDEPIGVVRLWIGEVSIRVGGHEYLFEPGDGWDVELRNADGAVVARHDDRALRDDVVVAGDHMAGGAGREGLIPGETSGNAWDRTLDVASLASWH